jgi:hypothetical protein
VGKIKAGRLVCAVCASWFSGHDVAAPSPPTPPDLSLDKGGFGGGPTGFNSGGNFSESAFWRRFWEMWRQR